MTLQQKYYHILQHMTISILMMLLKFLGYLKHMQNPHFQDLRKRKD